MMPFLMTLVAPQDICQRLPLSPSIKAFVFQSRLTIQRIISGEDSRLLLIIGPCSIHDIVGAKDYAKRLSFFASSIASTCFIAMRVYLEKPRTALGWRGFVCDPYLDGSDAMEKGYTLSRELLLYLAEQKIAVATEFLNPLSALYYGDLVSWACVGARTVNSPIHRQMAAALPMPVAFKNSIEGSIEAAVNGCLAASHPQALLAPTAEGGWTIQKVEGNRHTHLVLRGGPQGPNYDITSVQQALTLLARHKLPESVLIDCAHGNSGKQSEEQKRVFEAVLQLKERGVNIRGLMLESYLEEGTQSLSSPPLRYGVSITDPCLSWASTEALLAKLVKQEI